MSDLPVVVDAALNLMTVRPLRLGAALASAASLHDVPAVDVEDLILHLSTSGPNDAAAMSLRRRLVAWDHEESPSWAADTARNTEGRRGLIYELLGLDADARAFLGTHFPPAFLERPIVIAEDHEHWWTPARKSDRDFYWRSVSRYLRETRGFPEENLQSLDEATDDIISRIADPERPEVRKTRGLVVGYVQSGKTTNFTSLLAKGIDAGFKLIIVLSGTTNLLRNQTQRRIDMELVGKENILLGVPEADAHEYSDDVGWADEFISHGMIPAAVGAPGIVRLTGAKRDFTDLETGISALMVEKANPALPVWDPANLHLAKARVVVMKKNAARLSKLIENLGRLGPSFLAEIPTLLIDDESDQASVNTVRPDTTFMLEEKRRRSAINSHIRKVLALLPRCQYVGYTATPFANVFVDPDDADDIYPGDFIISLPEPTDYMGVFDFHDLDADLDPIERPGLQSNFRAHVREVKSSLSDQDSDLQKALDTFLLMGAVKLFREEHGCGSFRHHTMLVHDSQRTADHEYMRGRLENLWANAGYDAGTGVQRLAEVFLKEAPVSRERAPELPYPTTFDELLSFIGAARQRIDGGDGPLLVVNSTEGASIPDFDAVPVWKVIIGGAKLSRGYTVEGLTVSYFRRRATYADTLMQMGRWFGYRRNYRDLVRLFIGRKEPLNSAGTRHLDLYAAFQGLCRDEEMFRRELSKYSTGEQRITPREVPPLVTVSHPQLTPVAPNKMFNVELKARNFGGEWIAKTLCSDFEDDLQKNAGLFDAMLSEHGSRSISLSYSGGPSVDGVVSLVPHNVMLDALERYVWARDLPRSPLSVELQFLAGRMTFGDPGVEDWAVFLPQLKTDLYKPWVLSDGQRLRTIGRSRVTPTRFGVFAGSNDRKAARAVIDGAEPSGASTDLKALRQSRGRGVMLLYPVWELDGPDRALETHYPTLGFELIPPHNDLPTSLGYSRRTKSDQFVVPLPA